MDFIRIFCLSLFVLFVLKCKAQSPASFGSLNLPANSLISGLGGMNASLPDRSVNLFIDNPALNSDSLMNWGEASYLFYFADIGMASVAFQGAWGKAGAMHAGIQHLDLGVIEGFDATGLPTGSFGSSETVITIGKAHQAGKFRIGLNTRLVISSIAGYRASALAFDLGGVYLHPEQQLTVGLVLKNMGLVLKDYGPASASQLPFDVRLGVTIKPEHMPLRFSATAHRLGDSSIPYHDSNSNPEALRTLDKVMSHLNFGAEILAHKNINLLLGYNFLRHRELQLEGAGGGSGISLGAAARVKNTELVFSRSGYVTGGSYQISVGTNMKQLF